MNIIVLLTNIAIQLSSRTTSKKNRSTFKVIPHSALCAQLSEIFPIHDSRFTDSQATPSALHVGRTLRLRLLIFYLPMFSLDVATTQINIINENDFYLDQRTLSLDFQSILRNSRLKATPKRLAILDVLANEET
jgi:hypothetical protein